MSDSDDDMPQLSAQALAALQEFYAEQQETDENEQKEDWQLSQFWYSEETSERLAQEAIAVAGDYGRIACISCPTLYKKLRTMKKETCTAVVLEFDKRFATYGEDFIFYDYNDPLGIPDESKGSFDLVVADPPFLSEECLQKTSQTIKYMATDKVLLCTGAVMEELAKQLLDAKVCNFKPKHEKNLANEFQCYANYETLTLNKE